MIRRRSTTARRGGFATAAVLVLTALAGVAIAAFAFKVPSDRGGGEPLEVTLAGASKAKLTIANSRRGHAILTGRRMAPGDRVRGTVRLRNRSDRPVRLVLRRRGLRSPRNADGQRLAPRLHLLVRRMRPNGRRIYSGPLKRLARKRAGRLRPGVSRRYRFVVRLRDSGIPADESSGDNLLENAQARVGFVWQARRASQR